MRGNLYGSTEIGGNLSCIGPAFYAGCGVVFKLDTTGKETVLYSFTSGADGFGPASVILDQSSGIVYGTTRWGGDFTNCQYGCGTVFKLDTAGKKTILYTFTGGTDGAGPGRLIRDAAGDFYGTAAGGGQSGQGVVFKMTPPAIKEGAAWTETVLYSFTGAADGANPWGDPLTRDSAGSFYGVTLRGGDTSCSNRIEGKGCGVVFKLDTSGSLTVLHTFEKGDGTNPEGGLVRDTLGNLYGTAYFGGDLNCEHGYGCGVIFKISP